uniref:Uncharacterized protein n=1 Tax=Ditylenchus dipsaci TaxID=166011 RepID=A0A915D8X1_9BILA
MENRNEALRQQSEMRKKLLENNKKDIEKLEKKTVELMDTIEQAVQKLQLKKTNHQEKHEQYLMVLHFNAISTFKEDIIQKFIQMFKTENP